MTAVPTGLLRGARMLATGCLVVTTCLLAAGCVPDLKGGSEQAGPPQVGQCYDTPDTVLPDPHDPSPPVGCDQPHTLETYAVLRADGPLDQQTVARLGDRCAEGIEEFLGGGDFTQTAVSIYFFAPTKAEQDQGARWVRCDAGVITDTAVSGARPVTGTLRDAFEGGVPMQYRRCLDAPPNPTERQPLVPCVQPHVAQQMPTGVDLEDLGERYPGLPALTGEAQQRCSEAVRQALPGADRSMVIVPTPTMWRTGTTTAQCWAVAAPGERLNDSEAQPA